MSERFFEVRREKYVWYIIGKLVLLTVNGVLVQGYVLSHSRVDGRIVEFKFQVVSTLDGHPLAVTIPPMIYGHFASGIGVAYATGDPSLLKATKRSIDLHLTKSETHDGTCIA